MANPGSSGGEPSDVTRQAQARADRAVAAAVAVASAHGLRPGEPVVLASAYAVRVHLAPAPVVARVPTLTAWVRKPIEPWLARELAVVTYLASRGAPVVPPSAELPPGPHVHDGLAMTFWQYVETIPGRTATPAETGRMLGELHAVLRDYPGELPLLAPPRNDIPACLELLDRARDHAGALAPGDLDMLHAAWDRLGPRLHALAGPLQPVHGDAHAGNVLATPQGLLWNDFEDISLGPVAWDLTSLAMTGEDALSAYPDAPDTAVMELCNDARMLQVACWLAALPPVFDGQEKYIENMLDYWRARR
jgi:aminoglycoside phosphotransferase (APT) family kinase protein